MKTNSFTVRRTIAAALLGVVAITSPHRASGGDNERDAKIDSPEQLEAKKKALPDIADISFEDGMTGKAFHDYLHVKMALANDDADEARTAAGNLAETFTEERAELKATAERIARSEDIEEQRKLFSEFTNEIEPLFVESHSEGSFYKQHCPMAFDNRGAFWFSDTKEIENPYFGEKMPECGSTREEFVKNR